jgi:hypothetical protein
MPGPRSIRWRFRISRWTRERQVVVVDVEDRPGVLADLTRRIARAGVDLDLVYVATRNRVVFGAADLGALKGRARRRELTAVPLVQSPGRTGCSGVSCSPVAARPTGQRAAHCGGGRGLPLSVEERQSRPPLPLLVPSRSVVGADKMPALPTGAEAPVTSGNCPFRTCTPTVVVLGGDSLDRARCSRARVRECVGGCGGALSVPNRVRGSDTSGGRRPGCSCRAARPSV